MLSLCHLRLSTKLSLLEFVSRRLDHSQQLANQHLRVLVSQQLPKLPIPLDKIGTFVLHSLS